MYILPTDGYTTSNSREPEFGGTGYPCMNSEHLMQNPGPWFYAWVSVPSDSGFHRLED